MALKRVSNTKPIIIQGKPGDRGKPGKDGVTTTITKTVIEPGKPGKAGQPPEHEVRNGEIRFKQPDGKWGKWMSIGGGGGGGVSRHQDLTDIQGGIEGEQFHLTQAQLTSVNTSLDIYAIIDTQLVGTDGNVMTDDLGNVMFEEEIT